MTKTAVKGRDPKLTDRNEITVAPYINHAGVRGGSAVVASAEAKAEADESVPEGEKRSDPTDYPREKPKNPKGRSVGPPCLATRGKNHGTGERSIGFFKKKRKKFRVGRDVPTTAWG
jgi:hypothetical protein